MRNLLAIRNATRLQKQNITKQVRENLTPEGCQVGGQCIDIGLVAREGTFGVLNTIPAGCYCVNSLDSVSFLFAEGLTVEGFDSDGNQIGPKTNAWGISTSYVKVTVPNTLTNVRYMYNYFDISNPLERYLPNSDYRHVAVFKEWDGTMKSEADVRDKDKLDLDLTVEQFHAFSSKITVTYETEDTLIPSYDPYPDNLASIDPKKGTFSTKYASAYVMPSDFDLDKVENKKYSAEAKIEVKIDETNGFYPNKIFQMKPNMIFDNDVEEYDFLAGGLSGGAIAGIVIACVVVVAVVVFCIVWFVVLKKGCCCGKGGNNDAEA